MIVQNAAIEKPRLGKNKLEVLTNQVHLFLDALSVNILGVNIDFT